MSGFAGIIWKKSKDRYYYRTIGRDTTYDNLFDVLQKYYNPTNGKDDLERLQKLFKEPMMVVEIGRDGRYLPYVKKETSKLTAYTFEDLVKHLAEHSATVKNNLYILKNGQWFSFKRLRRAR